MALADTAKLLASLDLDNRKFNAAANQSMGKLNQLGVKGVAIGTALGQGLEHLAEFGLRKLGSALTGGLDSLATLESATTAVDGALKQMGLTGAVTADQVTTWANQIEASVHGAFDDTAITQASSTLIRFGHVTTANLRPAMVVMTDLAAKTGSVESAATLLAKALADPTKAAGKLSRAGVVLTKTQQDEIKALVAAGKVGQAQKVILDALAVSTKGAADATQGPYAKSLATLKDTERDVQRAFATGFLPVIERVRDLLSKELAKPETLQRVKEFGQSLANGLDKLVTALENVDWASIGNALKIGGEGAKTIINAFLGAPDWLKAAVVGGWGLDKISGGALSSALEGAIGTGIKVTFGQFFQRGASPANPMFVADITGGKGAIPGAATGATGGIGALGKVFLVGEAVGLVAAVVGVQQEIAAGNTATGHTIHAALTQALAAPQTNRELTDKLAAIDSALRQFKENPALALVAGDSLKELIAMRAEVVAAIANGPTKPLNISGDPNARDDANRITAAINANLQPLPDKITARQKASFDALRDRIEGTRIATVDRLGAVKSAVDLARINQIAAQRTGADRIVTAIHGIKAPIVHVTVNNRTVTSVYSTGRTVTRTASTGSYNAGLSG